MPSYRTGTVTAVLLERPGLQRVEVDGHAAYVLTQVVPPVAVGDRVVINTTAVDLGLGTGGAHVVHWNLERDAWSAPGPGHEMKLRYTSLQVDAGAAEREAENAPARPGLPVVALALHSQLAPVAVACKAAAPHRRLVYVMTEGGALPLAISDLVADLRDRGLIDATVTTGHAFGGDAEAVNLRSGLLVAERVLGADVIVTGMGPGSLGTGTASGFSGLEVAAIVDAAADAGHRPIVALRYSDADARPRHTGVSHHSHAALAAAHRPGLIAVPRGEPHPDAVGDHQVVEVDVGDAAALLAEAGVVVTTMGRTPTDEPRFFAYAAAAGTLAAVL